MAKNSNEKLKEDCLQSGATAGTIITLILWWNDIVSGLWGFIACLLGITLLVSWLLFEGNSAWKNRKEKSGD